MSDSPIKVQVRCFASVRELFGRDVLEVEIPAGATVAALRAQLAREHPAIASMSLAQAVNQGYAADDRVLEDGDEVAFIPPISGGSGEPPRSRFGLQHEPLDPRPLEAEARTDADGAIVTFHGVTRDHNDGQRVRGLSYEAYAEMADKLMAGLFDDAFERFEITRVRVAHRLGEVPIGEASVLVVVSSAHRGAAFDACRYLMDRIKAEVPIFKKESLEDGGDSRWVGKLPEV